MRQALINENADLVADNARYVMRITGGDPEGLDQLDNFIDPESSYPVLVTTSRLLSTGVDVQSCRLIALDREIGSMTEFKQAAERKQAIVDELAEQGLPLEVIAEELGRDLDPFDLVCHIAFDAKPLTRRERAENVKKRDAFNRYGEPARAVLEALLAKYADEGVLNLDDTRVLTIPPLNSLGTPVQRVNAFGGKQAFEHAIHELQTQLYEPIA